MKKELANLLCWIRIFGSLIVLLAGFLRIKLFWIAFLQSSLLITDVFDGYFYRKYAQNDPPKHWFNKFGITMDPIADFVFGVCGLIYLAKLLDPKIYFLTISVAILSITANLIGRNSPLVMKLLTYGWFLIAMLIPTILIWVICCSIKEALMGVFITFVLFEFCLWRFGAEKKFRKD